MSKALVASRLCQALAKEAAEDDLDVEVCQEFKSLEKEFEDLGKNQQLKLWDKYAFFFSHPVFFSLIVALELLDTCHASDDNLTQFLLTASLEKWSRKTCLSLALRAHNIR